ncbi:OsmC family protein [Paenibacillus athensensis]|uniref:Osmotically inducible protein C n=1 Tax=Paenibacillus athensensis TaxID=1967502 RepID=A0A4Y8Q4I1_9BACL|nr:OsmC family protein [Paenibacillus athensensis]MCD1258365.1 OsmC family protein [Paenibacillus athensensis]
MKIAVHSIGKKSVLAVAGTHSVVLDQGVERGGENIGFRPTELWLIGAAACAQGTLKHRAVKLGYEVSEVRIQAEDRLDEAGRIAAVEFRVLFEGEALIDQRQELLAYVREHCKVVRTIHPSIAVTFVDVREELEELPAAVADEGAA